MDAPAQPGEKEPTTYQTKKVDEPVGALEATGHPGTGAEPSGLAKSKSGPGSSGEGSRRTSSEAPPPLPPRPTTIDLLDEEVSSSSDSPRSVRPPTRRSGATTALSLTDINSQAHPDWTKDIYSSLPSRAGWGRSLKAKASLSQLTSARGSDTGDSASIRSFVPNAGATSEDENLFDGFLEANPCKPGREPKDQSERAEHSIETGFLDDDSDLDFNNEFDPIGELAMDGENEEMLLEKWKSKRKHFLILSAAGKPIYTRHGDNGIISHYIGIIQTIISFYQGSDDALRSFKAGEAKFVILTQGPLHLVGISRLLESDSQIRVQLEALYMQILSTLTLPALTHIFSVRPSTDLRRPLQGTETLLSSLADTFTRGSPSTLFTALECLKMRKSHRQAINNTLLKNRVESLLYGLVVAGGRLVSVVRPKKHSLHPGDLQLLFNMIFEADGVKAGGGQNWIPVCLPGFNSKGYLYMYVSFLDLREDAGDGGDESTSKDESVAIILISADKESFYELQGMRETVVDQLKKNGSIQVMQTAIEKGRPLPTDIVPGTVLRHFIYKSKANVQFTMSSYGTSFTSLLGRRRLLSTYTTLHASVHAKHAHVKIHHNISRSANSLAWVTPVFEFYCVAGPNTNRNALSSSANKIIQWVQQEEERVFIIGGAVF